MSAGCPAAASLELPWVASSTLQLNRLLVRLAAGGSISGDGASTQVCLSVAWSGTQDPELDLGPHASSGSYLLHELSSLNLGCLIREMGLIIPLTSLRGCED